MTLVARCREYYKEIKQEIVHTSLSEEYDLSKKWMIIMDRRQDLNSASTPAETNGPSAHDHSYARSLRGGSKKRRNNETRFLMKQNALQANLMNQNALQANFSSFD